MPAGQAQRPGPAPAGAAGPGTAAARWLGLVTRTPPARGAAPVRALPRTGTVTVNHESLVAAIIIISAAAARAAAAARNAGNGTVPVTLRCRAPAAVTVTR